MTRRAMTELHDSGMFYGLSNRLPPRICVATNNQSAAVQLLMVQFLSQHRCCRHYTPLSLSLKHVVNTDPLLTKVRIVVVHHQASSVGETGVKLIKICYCVDHIFSTLRIIQGAPPSILLRLCIYYLEMGDATRLQASLMFNTRNASFRRRMGSHAKILVVYSLVFALFGCAETSLPSIPAIN